MPYYRKKPVVVEAFRFGYDPTPPWAELGAPGQSYVKSVTPTTMVIHTLEGDHSAEVGDWIIRGVAGELYPCKDAIFRLTYEPANEPG